MSFSINNAITTLYMIRHGEPDPAYHNCYYGQQDVPLSETGREQSRAARDRLAGVALDAVYSSDLERAAYLAELLAEARGLPVRRLVELRERHMGQLQGIPVDVLERDHAEIFQSWRADIINYRCPEAENFIDLHERIVPALEELVAAFPGKRLAVVCHAGPIRVALAHALGMPLENIFRLSVNYCGIHVIEYPEGKPPRGRPMLPLPEILVYLMLPGAAALCLQFSLLTPDLLIFGSALVLGAFWIGFYRFKAPLVLLILLGCILTSRVNFPPLSVALMTASALAGGVGAWLTRAEAEEDDFFFLPLLTLVGLLALMIAMGAGGGWGKMAGRIVGFLNDNVKEMHAQFPGYNFPESLNLNHLLLATVVVIEALALWLAGRLARRLMGRLRGLKSSLMVFRIQQRYIFLLILGLILEIFSSLTMSDTLAYLAWPLLGVIALAGLLGGLGIVLFIGAMQRMSGQGPGASLWTAAGVAISVVFWYITALVGLADAWFDFRKLERLRRQLEDEARDPDE